MTEAKQGSGRVQIFTDGACSGNPGLGGWGAILRFLLTRLADWFVKPPEVRLNPADYLKRLRFHQQVQNVSEYGLELAA